jgi:hypothetical protein
MNEYTVDRQASKQARSCHQLTKGEQGEQGEQGE